MLCSVPLDLVKVKKLISPTRPPELYTDPRYSEGWEKVYVASFYSVRILILFPHFWEY
jgi:hypothetical protein